MSVGWLWHSQNLPPIVLTGRARHQRLPGFPMHRGEASISSAMNLHYLTKLLFLLSIVIHLHSDIHSFDSTSIAHDHLLSYNDTTTTTNFYASLCNNGNIFPLAPQEPFVRASRMPRPVPIHPEHSWSGQWGGYSSARQGPVHRIYGGHNVCPMNNCSLSLANGLQFDPPLLGNGVRTSLDFKNFRVNCKRLLLRLSRWSPYLSHAFVFTRNVSMLQHGQQEIGLEASNLF